MTILRSIPLCLFAWGNARFPTFANADCGSMRDCQLCQLGGELAEPKGREKKWICRLGFNR
jgi:hypothetical protein